MRRSGIHVWIEKNRSVILLFTIYFDQILDDISAARSKTKIFVLGEINIWAAKSCVIWWSNLQKSFWFGKSIDNLDNSDFVILFNLAKQRSEDEGQLFLTGRKILWHFNGDAKAKYKKIINRRFLKYISINSQNLL